MKQMAVESAVSQSATAQSAAAKNSTILYAAIGGTIVLLLLVVGVVVSTSNSGPTDHGKIPVEELSEGSQTDWTDLARNRQADAEEQEKLKVAEEERLRLHAEEKAEKKRLAEEAAAERLRAEAEKKAEDELKAEEAKKQKLLDSELVSVTERLKAGYPLAPLQLGVSGEARKPETRFSDFKSFIPLKERVRFRYVSYLPRQFSSENSNNPGEIVISFHDESPDSTAKENKVSGSSEIYRFALDDEGLSGKWLDSTNITKENYRQINGLILGELEIIQASNDRVIKNVSLFEPIETEAFQPIRKKLDLSGLACDFGNQELSAARLSIMDVQGYRPRYEWTSLSNDTLRFKVEDDYHADIRLVPQTPLLNNDGEWDMPIVVEEIKRNCDQLNRFARETGTQPEQVDQKIDVGTKVTNQARSERSKVRRQISRNSSSIKRASSSIDALNRKLTVARGSAASSISSQISQQRSIISNCQSANRQLMPERNRTEARYNDYRKKLDVFENYKAMLDKPSIIYRSEPITFAVHLAHPDDQTRTLLLLSMKSPDISTVSDSVLPPMPTGSKDEDDDKDEDEDEENEMDEKDTMKTPENDPAGEASKRRAFLDVE